MSIITVDLLTRAGASADGAKLYAGPLAAACDARGITSTTALRPFLANVLNESAGLTRAEENLNYTTATRLREVFPSHFASVAAAQPYVNNPAAVAQHVYGNCQGRGLGELTGASNYAAYAKAKGMPADQIAAYLVTPEGAADSAAWFFVWRGCAKPAALGDLLGVTRLWEGAGPGANPIGWSDVQRWHGQVSRAMGAAPIANPVAASLHAGAATVVKPVLTKSSPQPTADALMESMNPVKET